MVRKIIYNVSNNITFINICINAFVYSIDNNILLENVNGY